MIRTRFAPSPTGFIHIGNLRTALFAYLIAKKNNGKFILRIEDTDRARSDTSFLKQIYSSLEMLGIDPDEGPANPGKYGPYIQSERIKIYKKYINRLVDKGLAYQCFCTPEELQEKRKKHDNSKELPFMYDRSCRSLTENEIISNIKNKEAYVIRQKMPTRGSIKLRDMVFGEIEIENAQLDDQVLFKSDGYPTYNFANVVDDHLMDITHIVRGYEYLSSTPKYLHLYDSLDWKAPETIHLPHIIHEDGKKISKRMGDFSFSELTGSGYLPAAIVNYISLLGWNPGCDNEIFSVKELVNQFSPSRIKKSNAVFSLDKLNWFNKYYIQKMEFSEFHEKAIQFYSNDIFKKISDLEYLSKIIKERITTFSEIPKLSSFLISNEIKFNIYDFRGPKRKLSFPKCQSLLRTVLESLGKLSRWEKDELYSNLKQTAVNENISFKDAAWTVRYALSGLRNSLGNATDLLYLLKEHESIVRIEKALSFLTQSKQDQKEENMRP